MDHFSVKNFEKFQHYKDRSPPWIKLYNELLDDYAFASMPDEHKCHLMLIWLLASRMDNKVPLDPVWVGNRIGASAPVNLDALNEAGFLVMWDESAPVGKREEWPTRYIPDKVRAQVFARDLNRCVKCGSTEKLEIDHIVPVSKGGHGVLENLQLLCCRCNRRKRNSMSQGELGTTEQLATQKKNLRSLETEGERETEQRQNREEVAAQPSSTGVDGSPADPPCVAAVSEPEQSTTAIVPRPTTKEYEVYDLYPRKVGKAAALKAIRYAYKQLAQRGELDPWKYLTERTRAYGESRVEAHLQSEGEIRFTPHPATWFNQGRYDDDPAEWRLCHTQPRDGPMTAREGSMQRFDDELEALFEGAPHDNARIEGVRQGDQRLLPRGDAGAGGARGGDGGGDELPARRRGPQDPRTPSRIF